MCCLRRPLGGAIPTPLLCLPNVNAVLTPDSVSHKIRLRFVNVTTIIFFNYHKRNYHFITIIPAGRCEIEQMFPCMRHGEARKTGGVPRYPRQGGALVLVAPRGKCGAGTGCATARALVGFGQGCLSCWSRLLVLLGVGGTMCAMP